MDKYYSYYGPGRDAPSEHDLKRLDAYERYRNHLLALMEKKRKNWLLAEQMRPGSQPSRN